MRSDEEGLDGSRVPRDSGLTGLRSDATENMAVSGRCVLGSGCSCAFQFCRVVGGFRSSMEVNKFSRS